MRWPLTVRTTRPATLRLATGTVALPEGRELTATAMGDDGTLTVLFGQQRAALPFTETDLIDRAAPP